jgi:hypothetical protein
MGLRGLSHSDDGIDEDLHLAIQKPGLHPVVGPVADGLVLYGERHAQAPGLQPSVVPPE